jgi:hypothetical protein
VNVHYRPFHYYPYAGARPLLCELDHDNFVYMSHNDSVIHRAKYSGKFVPLVELHTEGEQTSGHPDTPQR